jgi:hypothetical protein
MVVIPLLCKDRAMSRQPHIWVDDTEMRVTCCFECGKDLKAELPRRRWDPHIGFECWRAPSIFFDTAQEILARRHDHVPITDERTKVPTMHEPMHLEGGVHWTRAMFAELPRERHKFVFRALMRVLPDDDSTDQVQALLDSWRDVQLEQKREQW